MGLRAVGNICIPLVRLVRTRNVILIHVGLMLERFLRPLPPSLQLSRGNGQEWGKTLQPRSVQNMVLVAIVRKTAVVRPWLFPF